MAEILPSVKQQSINQSIWYNTILIYENLMTAASEMNIVYKYNQTRNQFSKWPPFPQILNFEFGLRLKMFYMIITASSLNFMLLPHSEQF